MNPGISRLFSNLLPGVLAVWLPFSSITAAAGLDFSLHKLTGDKPGPTLLVIGGIQGDEPGGFNAASLLVTDYVIQRGQLWVVPNLNFASIIRRSRGIHGDMNRKFLQLQQDDPEFVTVQKIKQIILDDQVDIILNLHDGSGFYSPAYINKHRNPHRWGQSIIIDQQYINTEPHGELESIATRVIRKVNQSIKPAWHRYHLRNTRTRHGDVEMEKTLTYFAVRHHKSAFGVEASKHFPTHERAFYHLQVVEAFMQYLGIDYRRQFELSPDQVKYQINNGIRLSMYGNKLVLDVSHARSTLRYVPMQRDLPLQLSSNNPLVAVIDANQHYTVRYGNRGMTRLLPEYREFDDSLQYLTLVIDGEQRQVQPGSIVAVDREFMVLPMPDYRVNIIGFTRGQLQDETGVVVRQADIMRRFSVDRMATKYRVEVYKGRKFSGMIMIDFAGSATPQPRHALAYYPQSQNRTD